MKNVSEKDDSFITVRENVFSEEIKRSLFISYAYPVCSDEDAQKTLSLLKSKHYDATHVCYAYVTDSSARFSDDGEPAGTAGKPILDIINGAGCRRTLIAVARYFGGIKLGTGGLVHAYSNGAKQVLNSAEKVEVRLCDVFKLSFDYALYQKIQKNLVKLLCKIVEKSYNNNVDLTVAVTHSEKNDFIFKVGELTLGKTAPEYIATRYEEITSGVIY